MHKTLLLILFYFSFQSLQGQVLIVQDAENGKIKTLKSGKIIGVITDTDTLYGDNYSDSTRQYYADQKKGVHQLRLSKLYSDRITLLNRLTQKERLFNLADIRYVTFPKERRYGYRYGLALVGVFGTVVGVGSLITYWIQQKPLGPSIISIGVGIGAIGILHLTRKWSDDRRYRVLRIE